MSDDLLDCLLSVAADELNSTEVIPKPKLVNNENEDERFLEKISTTEPFLKSPKFNLQTQEINKLDSVVHTGDTDSSDDESNKYFEKYNDFGKSVKLSLSLLGATSEPRNNDATWKVKKDNSKQLALPAKLTSNSDVYTDPIFGIRIVNPLISSTVLKERMIGREGVPMIRLKRHVSNLKSGQDWVIGGVIVHKSASKTSQKGSQFSIWTLSDLQNDLKTVTLFMFGNAYKQLWKTVTGTVVGVLNPAVLEKNEGSKEEVCKKFNEIGSKYLSRGFVQIEKRHATIYKKIKALLPRRESERRVHPLARHCDILSAVETRISMLNMTFMKYMENNLCCFIPGKVIDEIERVLTIVEAEGPPPRTHELLQELRDISSMAMEHFEEQILPNVKMQIEQPPIILPSTSKSSKVVIVQYAIADEVRKVKKQNKFQKVQISALVERLDKFNRKLQRQNLHMRVQSIKLKDQERKLQEQSIKMQEQESTIADIRKHMDEWAQKFADLTSEVRARDDFNCKSPNKQFTQPSTKFHLPNIKPRKAQVLPKTCNQIKIELERKRKADLVSDIPSKILKNEGSANFTEMLQNIKNNSPTNFDLNENQILPNRRSSLGTFISSSFETFLKNPISSIKSRKRKISEDTNIKYGLMK